MANQSENSHSLIKRPSDTALMPPPPPPKRIKRPPKVLDEDDYTDALSHIIARDFFPGLLETQTQQEYLDALASKDKEWIASAGRRLEEVMTPGPAGQGRGRRGVSLPTVSTPRATPRGDNAGGGATPRDWTGDTPMSVVSSTSTTATATSSRARPAVPGVERMSLGAFQAKYTSEDNESFNKLLDKQNEKKRREYAWMWSGNKIPTARQIAHRKREAKRLEAQRRIDLIEDGEKGKDKDSGKQLIIANSDDARPAKPDAWKSKPDNSLMFTPSSIEDTHETVQQKAEADSRAGPKQVVYHNTRIQPVQSSDSHSSAVPPSSPSISAIRDAIAGRPRYSDTETAFAGGETPRVNGYAFVDEDEPEPHPTQTTTQDDESYRLSLLGTASSGTPNPFKLQETRKREALHHRMVERVARNKRTEKIMQGTKTPVPMFTSSPMIRGTPRSGLGSGGPSLTPAAQRLWANVGTPKRSGAGSGIGGLKNMWTPTPKRTK